MAGLRNWTRVLAGAVALWLPAVSAAADELHDITARGRLLVGVTESSPPFSFLEPAKGIVGYDEAWFTPVLRTFHIQPH